MITDITVEGSLAIVQEGTNDPHHHERGSCGFKFDGDNLIFHAGRSFVVFIDDLTIGSVAPGTKGAAITALKGLFPNANTGTGGTGTDTGSGKVDGLAVIWTGLLNFTITAGHGKLNGVTYPLTLPASFTLENADPTNPRIDLIGVQIASNGTELEAFFIAGTPATDPAEPGYDNLTQLRLSIVTIQAGATVPDISNITLYDENLGTGGGEWDVTNTATINKDSASHPEHGSKSIAVTGMNNGQSITFTAADFMNVSTVDKLIIPIWLVNALNNNRNLVVSLMNGSTVVTNTIQFTTKGMARNRTGVQQYVVVDTSQFTYSNTNFNRIRIAMTGSGNPAISFVLDDIRFQIGLVQQPIPSIATIYTSNGTIFSDRTINGNVKNVVVNNLNSWLIRDHNSRNQFYLSDNQVSITSNKNFGGANLSANFQTRSDVGDAGMSATDLDTGETSSLNITKTRMQFQKSLVGDVTVTINFSKKGLQLTNMTKAERNALVMDANDDKGYCIFQTDSTPGMRMWNGLHWVRYTETNDD